MQQEGYDCSVYQRLFADYIWNSQFLSWEDLRERYDFFVRTVMMGQALPPLATWRGKLTVPTGLRGEIQELQPFEQVGKLIVHYVGTLIINYRGIGKAPTLQDLYNELMERGIIPPDTPFEEFKIEVKNVVTAAFKRKDIDLFRVTEEEINDFLAT